MKSSIHSLPVKPGTFTRLIPINDGLAQANDKLSLVSGILFHVGGVPMHRCFSKYLEYWHSLARTDKIPPLTECFDKPDAQIHPWLNIVDVDQESVQPIRFAGTQLIDYFGQDMTRANFLDLLSPQARPIIQDSHRQIIQGPCGAFHESVCTTATGRKFELQAMGLPLVRANGLHCVAWLLEPRDTVAFGEVRVLVQRIIRWSWVDLGFGTP